MTTEARSAMTLEERRIQEITKTYTREETTMDKDAAFDAISATWHVLPPMKLFILKRQELVKCQTMPNFDEMFAALQTLRDACTTAHVQVMCRRLETLADNRLLFPADTMPGFLSHGTANGYHGKGSGENLSHNTKLNGHAQQLHDIIRAR